MSVWCILDVGIMLGDSYPQQDARGRSLIGWSGKQAVYRKGSCKEQARAVALAFLSSYVLDIAAVSRIF